MFRGGVIILFSVTSEGMQFIYLCVEGYTRSKVHLSENALTISLVLCLYDIKVFICTYCKYFTLFVVEFCKTKL